MTSHSDRELMKMALNALEEAWGYGYTDPTVLNALRDRLAQPEWVGLCLLYTSPSPRDLSTSRMPSSA